VIAAEPLYVRVTDCDDDGIVVADSVNAPVASEFVSVTGGGVGAGNRVPVAVLRRDVIDVVAGLTAVRSIAGHDLDRRGKIPDTPIATLNPPSCTCCAAVPGAD